MDKKQMDSELALLEIETLVSNYTKTEVDIFISILCVPMLGAPKKDDTSH